MEATSLIRGDTEEYMKDFYSPEIYDPLTPVGMASPPRLTKHPSGDDMFGLSAFLELPSPSPLLRRNTRRGQSTELSNLIHPLQDEITDLLPMSPVDTTAKGNGGKTSLVEEPFGEEGERLLVSWFRNTSGTIMTRSKSAELRRRFEQVCNNNSQTTFTELLAEAGKPPEIWSAGLKRTLNLRKGTWPTATPTQAPVSPTRTACPPEEPQNGNLDSRNGTPQAELMDTQPPPPVIPPTTITPEVITQATPTPQRTASQTTSQASLKTKTRTVARHVVSPNCPIHGHLAHQSPTVTGAGNGKSVSAGAHSGLGPRTPGHAVALRGRGGEAAIPGATVVSAGVVLSGAGGSPPRSLVTGSVHYVESNSDAQTSLAKRVLENGEKPVDQPPRKRPSIPKVTENVAERQQQPGSTAQVLSINNQSSLERTPSVTADNIIGNIVPQNKGRTHAEEKKKLRQARLKRRIEAKERCPNCAKGIPETLVDARKKIAELESELTRKKRYEEFMNKMDSEHTKVIEELKDKEKALLGKIKKLEQKVKALGGRLEDSD